MKLIVRYIFYDHIIIVLTVWGLIWIKILTWGIVLLWCPYGCWYHFIWAFFALLLSWCLSGFWSVNIDILYDSYLLSWHVITYSMIHWHLKRWELIYTIIELIHYKIFIWLWLWIIVLSFIFIELVILRNTHFAM